MIFTATAKQRTKNKTHCGGAAARHRQPKLSIDGHIKLPTKSAVKHEAQTCLVWGFGRLGALKPLQRQYFSWGDFAEFANNRKTPNGFLYTIACLCTYCENRSERWMDGGERNWHKILRPNRWQAIYTASKWQSRAPSAY